jgi:sigma54-dependent transcription regulator
VDCGSLVPTLIESELFGYVKGAFTGAMQSKEGLLAIAEGGTVFLDEVGELPVDLQAKMLRAVLFEHLGPAVPLFVDFGISGVERILRELRAALLPRGREMVLARHSARQSLRDELKDDVTALLLSCGIVWRNLA